MTVGQILARKRDGGTLSQAEIDFFIRGVVDGSIKDYQAAAWLMAVFLRGMNREEIYHLTLAMRDSGFRIDLSDLNSHPVLDKHSTGGVGDKTTLVVVPIVAAAGIPMLKMSGRGLGHTGGTVDKLESIPGFRTEMSVDAAKEQVREIGAALISQSSEIAPADRILYELRDVTATVESIPLIAASIMSKKLASGADRILLDVKAGGGAFMKSRAEAEDLARLLIEIGNGAGAPTSALVSPMEEPLGRAIGNALEVEEAVRMLLAPDEAEPNFAELCCRLAAHALVDAGRAPDEATAADQVSSLLSSGRAAAKLAQIVAAQGGPSTCDDILKTLPRAEIMLPAAAPRSGALVSIDAAGIGQLAMSMGAGRQLKTDPIDHAVGIVLHAKVGARVRAGAALATLHIRESDRDRIDEFTARLLDAIRVDPTSDGRVEPFWTSYLS